MSNSHSHQDVSSHVKLYLIIGAALLVGTVITVLASHIQMGITAGIIVAIIIASIKGSLVAGYFMHLKEERRLIYLVLALTAAFIVVMVGLFLFAFGDQQGLHGADGRHRGAFIVPDGHVKVHQAEEHGASHTESHTEGAHVP